MANINIENNTFNGSSKVFGEYNEYNFHWSDLEKEVSKLKDELDSSDPLKSAMTDLEVAIKSKEKNSIKESIVKYAKEFSTSTFASLASTGLIALVKMFLI